MFWSVVEVVAEERDPVLVDPEPLPLLTTPAEGPALVTPALVPGARAKFSFPVVTTPAVLVASPVVKLVSPLFPLESWAPD